jgi:hypothetical protein
MFDGNPFHSWSHIVIGGLVFAMVFEFPLVLGDYLTVGTVTLSWSTIAFAAAAFAGYVIVGGAIMKYSASRADL